MLDAMRDYFLDETREMPTDLQLFFWPYRGLRQTVLRGVGVMFGFTKVSPPPTVLGDFLKYFPAAFWLTSNAPDVITAQIADREIDPRNCAMNEERVLSIPTKDRDTFSADWPEHPVGSEALLLNEESCVYAEPA